MNAVPTIRSEEIIIISFAYLVFHHLAHFKVRAKIIRIMFLIIVSISES